MAGQDGLVQHVWVCDQQPGTAAYGWPVLLRGVTIIHLVPAAGYVSVNVSSSLKSQVRSVKVKSCSQFMTWPIASSYNWQNIVW